MRILAAEAMRMWRVAITAAGVAAALLPLPSCAQMAPPPTPTATFDDAASRSGVPFEIFRDSRLFLPVTVNGHAAVALLDTGAGITTVDAAFARSAGLLAAGSAGQASVSGMQMQLVSNVTVASGGQTLGGLTVAVADLSATAQTIGHPVQMILGREAFDQAVVDIDFASATLHFSAPAGFSPPSGAARLPVSETTPGQRGVPVSVEGRPPVMADIDLGNGMPFLVSADYAASARLLEGRPVSSVMASGLGGPSKRGLTTLAAISVGGFQLGGVPAMVNRSADEMPVRDVNIGFGVLSRFHLVFDYPQSALFLSPDPKRFALPFTHDRAGLRTSLIGARLRVTSISDGSPAAQAGWRPGEEIVAVNDHPIAPDFYATPEANWASGPAGTTVKLTLATGEARTLTLADYY